VTNGTATSRRMRADGQRSRARLLTAAEQIVARDGASASLEEIARVAGVGSATLHRHFPTRWVLLQAIFQERVEGLAALADTLLHGDEPDASLAKWLAELASITAGTSCSLKPPQPNLPIRPVTRWSRKRANGSCQQPRPPATSGRTCRSMNSSPW